METIQDLDEVISLVKRWSGVLENRVFDTPLNCLIPEGTLSLDALTRDGHEAPHSEIGIARDSQGARLLVDIDGSAHIAHVAKVGDDWWIHINGRIHVVHGHEPGSADSAAGDGGLTSDAWNYSGGACKSRTKGPRRPNFAGYGSDENGAQNPSAEGW